ADATKRHTSPTALPPPSPPSAATACSRPPKSPRYERTSRSTSGFRAAYGCSVIRPRREMDRRTFLGLSAGALGVALGGFEFGGLELPHAGAAPSLTID